MITRLYINNFYKHHGVTFDFSEGLTGIIGPNESGKSLIQEAIRYALFGSSALRTSAPKDLHVELNFTINGVDHLVVRQGGKARLDDQAVGIKPVNEAIIKLLGYDLEVFDIANSCNQGDVEGLSNMKPTARKAMIDRTVGLDVLDVAIDYCGKRGNALKSEAMGMRAALTAPTPPVAPEGYRPVAVLRPIVADLLADSREYNLLVGFLQGYPQPTTPRGLSAEELLPMITLAEAKATEWADLSRFISNTPPTPVAPEACVVSGTAFELFEYQQGRDEVITQRYAIEQTLKGLEVTTHTTETLDMLDAQHDQWIQWQERQRLLAQGHLCCPACGHTWPVAGNIPEVAETNAPTITRAEIRRLRGLLGNAQVKIDQETALAALVVPADRSAELRAVKAYDAAVAAFEDALEAHERYNAGLAAKQNRLAELAATPDTRVALKEQFNLANLWAGYDAAAPKRERLVGLEGCEAAYTARQAQLAVAQSYEQDLARFVTAQKVYESQMEAQRLVAEKSEVYLQARLDMHALKTRVKSHLLPSLNKVASSLLSEMTGGARYQVQVDEDFEILIDGTQISALSGSGKAVANLAIRLALGRILTNRMFSLFMADEIDGSMDEERADYVATALQRLTGTVKQVILITHKRPNTDHTIELKA